MTEALVVIDMQPGCYASHHRELKTAVRKEIERMRERNGYVVILELFPDVLGKSYPFIYKAISGYPKAFVKTKQGDSGALQVMEVFVKEELAPDRIRYCGVNAAECVISTIAGLVWWVRKAEVVHEACYDINHRDSKMTLLQFCNLFNGCDCIANGELIAEGT